MDSDVVSYATQSASNAIIEFGNCSIQCDILQENNFHTEEQLHTDFEKEAIQALQSHFQSGKMHLNLPKLIFN